MRSFYVLRACCVAHGTLWLLCGLVMNEAEALIQITRLCFRLPSTLHLTPQPLVRAQLSFGAIYS